MITGPTEDVSSGMFCKLDINLVPLAILGLEDMFIMLEETLGLDTRYGVSAGLLEVFTTSE